MKRKLMAVILSAAMVFSMGAVAFASDGDATTSYTSEDGITLIGAAPFAGATNVAPGNNSSKQPIRVALSGSVSDVVASINDDDDTNDCIEVTVGTEPNDTAVDVTASADGNIVVLTPNDVMTNNATYNVSFSGVLTGISGYSFNTSRGGSGGGTGTGSGGGQGGTQALTLTGQIPFGEMNADGTVASAMTVSAGQSLYAVFSNSLLPSQNNPANPDLKEDNLDEISVTDASGNAVACTIDITDSWTVKVDTDGLTPGSYRLVITDNLTANSGNKYVGKTIPFNIAA